MFKYLHNVINPPPAPIATLKKQDFDATERALLAAEAELERAIANRDMLSKRLARLNKDA